LSEVAQQIAQVLNTPGGMVFAAVLILMGGYMGKWRWDREVTERDATIKYQRELIRQLTRAASMQADTQRKANEVLARQVLDIDEADL
jgi:formate-dependent nitrite reductase cytochrome c552 subunit